MPLFRRSDGTPVRELSAMRRMMPYLMPSRSESVVYYEQTLDLSRTLPFLDARDGKRALFPLFLFALGRALHERPGLNRFVSGGRIYQREETVISFTAKQAFDDRAKLRTVKLGMPGGESFPDLLARLREKLGEARGKDTTAVEKEMKLFLRLPGFALGWLLGLARWLDRWNLFPRFLQRDDPMFASLFVTNLGSIGIDRCWHHLYEYGTVSLFCSIGAVREELRPGPEGPEARPVVRLMYTLDERINDGFYCVKALELVREVVEDPARFIPAD